MSDADPWRILYLRASALVDWWERYDKPMPQGGLREGLKWAVEKLEATMPEEERAKWVILEAAKKMSEADDE